MHLTDHQLRDIAIDAAQSLCPPERVGEVYGSVGVAFNGDEAYRFVIHLDQVDDREEAARLRIDLRLAIRDRPLAIGDDRYPYARILRRDAVGLGRTASSIALRRFAEVFVDFLERRQLADYDPFMPMPSQQEIESLIDEAARALQAFAALDPMERTDMLALMIAGARS